MANGGPTHYQRLGVAPNATSMEIRRAYRALAKVAHPDAGGDSDEFRLLTDAYDTLVNPLLRKEYDDRLQVDQYVQSQASFDIDGDEMTVRSKRDRIADEEGWAGNDGTFTGDFEVPSYLRDIFEGPWAESAEATAARDPSTDPTRREPPIKVADIAWWSPEPSIVAPAFAGQVVMIATPSAIVALDVFFGRDVWRAEVVAPVSCPAVLAGETIATWTTDGVLHGLELARGVTRWEVPIGEPGKGQLTVIGGHIIAATETHVLAIEPTMGKLAWQGSLVAPPTVPVVGVGTTAVVGTKRGVDAFDARKGKARWRAPTRQPVDLPLCPSEGSVWVSAGGGVLHRLDITNGASIGRWEVRSPIAGLVDEGAILFATVVGPAQLVAVDPSGFVRWATGLSETSPEPALIAGTAYVAEPSGRVVAIDTIDGSVLATVSLPFQPFGPPLGFVDRIIVQERGGRLWSVNLPALDAL